MKQVGLKTQKTRKYFYLRASYGCSINVYAKEVLFVSILSSKWRSHFGSLCTNEKRERESEKERERERQRERERERERWGRERAVSYTHLTLPTRRTV